jgi:Rrf2 family cysteine metabolism transcriptional repressor
MRLSTRSEYACLALIDLTEHYNRGLIKIRDICQRKDIPQKYLEQILLTLKRGAFLRSKRGVDGGYRLAIPPNKISIAQIIRLMDGPIAPVDSVSRYFFDHSPIEKSKELQKLFKEIRDTVSAKLENTTFADLCTIKPPLKKEPSKK